MANLLVFKDNSVVINPDILAIPEFKKLWDRDRSKTKESAYKELSYVYFIADYNSPYRSYPEGKRENLIIEDFIKDKRWKPDAPTIDAITKYKALSETPTMRLVRSVGSIIDRMSEYLDSCSIDEDTVKAIVDTITKTSAIVTSHAKLDEQVKKEIAIGGRSKGNRDIGEFER